ncbi:DUF6364 family protein [Mesorhizobium sp. YR577]|jgi:hypothetical protein|uniref:DUF6364 family protein n=1 Tax=Mesorhizobium sp. YR577 TaxID=1884373 RepID=UPI0008E56B5D|nr:DUF6364 family protein [Mesorhizobium sp. YR577]SFU19982.1 hypothetical protein SAMN05518861_12254 [Mesorhizobium sp. YR577]
MKNLTISLKEELLQDTRVNAAKAGKSMSQYVADLLERETSQETTKADEIKRRLEALQRVFDGPKWDITENGRMPTAEERNARR